MANVSRKIRKKPLRSKDVPVTKGMLDAFDGKMSKRMTSMNLRLKSHEKKFDSIEATLKSHDKRFESIEAKFSAVDKRFDAVDEKFRAVDKRFDSLEAKMDSKFEMVMSAIHHQTAVIEEQNARNKVVLDGYEQLYRRMDALEGR